MTGLHRVENHVNHKNHIKISGSDNLTGLHRVENHVNHKNHIKISGSDNAAKQFCQKKESKEF
jgi:hypothetical protein